MFLAGRFGPRLGINGLQPHFAHQAPDPLAVTR
jgi:hypothetical protein